MINIKELETKFNIEIKNEIDKYINEFKVKCEEVFRNSNIKNKKIYNKDLKNVDKKMSKYSEDLLNKKLSIYNFLIDNNKKIEKWFFKRCKLNINENFDDIDTIRNKLNNDNYKWIDKFKYMDNNFYIFYHIEEKIKSKSLDKNKFILKYFKKYFFLYLGSVRMWSLDSLEKIYQYILWKINFLNNSSYIFLNIEDSKKIIKNEYKDKIVDNKLEIKINNSKLSLFFYDKLISFNFEPEQHDDNFIRNISFFEEDKKFYFNINKFIKSYKEQVCNYFKNIYFFIKWIDYVFIESWSDFVNNNIELSRKNKINEKELFKKYTYKKIFKEMTYLYFDACTKPDVEILDVYKLKEIKNSFLCTTYCEQKIGSFQELFIPKKYVNYFIHSEIENKNFLFDSTNIYDYWNKSKDGSNLLQKLICLITYYYSGKDNSFNIHINIKNGMIDVVLDMDRNTSYFISNIEKYIISIQKIFKIKDLNKLKDNLNKYLENCPENVKEYLEAIISD